MGNNLIGANQGKSVSHQWNFISIARYIPWKVDFTTADIGEVLDFCIFVVSRGMALDLISVERGE